MDFTLIVCTYLRPDALLRLLQSVRRQTLYPNEILIIDGSTDSKTEIMLSENPFRNLRYFLVPNEQRGLTRQRNYGIERVAASSKIVCFLDDDTILEDDYFENLIKTYDLFPDALAVGGYIINEAECEYVGDGYVPALSEFYYDGWKRKDGPRFMLRKKLGLDSDRPPGFSPLFSHGRSVGFLPPSGKVYPADQIMGGVSSFKKEVFDSVRFSTYFEGYGLYEDADFSLRVARIGKLYVNTAAKLHHHHDESGRPNQYKYGKMVVRNGWYVWRIRNPKPNFNAWLKWNLITLLLTVIRFSNIFTTTQRKEALTETVGRTVGWWSLLFSKPTLQK